MKYIGQGSEEMDGIGEEMEAVRRFSEHGKHILYWVLCLNMEGAVMSKWRDY